MHSFGLSDTIRSVLSGGVLPGIGNYDPELAGKAFRAIADKLEMSASDIATLTDLVGKVRNSADPQMALNNTQRFVEATPEPNKVRVALKRSSETATMLITLMAGSQFLSDVLISQPDAFEWLISHDTLHGPRTQDYYRQGAANAVAGITDRAAQRAAMSRWRRREYLRIGSRDLLLLADAEDVSRDISDLAEAIIDQAAIIIYSELANRFGAPIPETSTWQETALSPSGNATPAGGFAFSTGMCVLGMGKLGGRELNFSSDIDLVFVYEAEGETAGRMDGSRRVAVISNHDFFTRMGEALVRFLSERGPAGNLFRVDMRLRPEGIDGPLARSLESFITYLNGQARDWERLAYLKARVVSGPANLAQNLYRVMAEFVFAGLDAERIVSEVQDLKMRIDREVITSDTYHREVKRGYGGIREIEFVIAAMQIIHGYNHHALRIRNTFLAIQRLLETHIITSDAAEFYQHAYSFLRTIEHRLQMAQEAQTHTLPLPGPEFEALARRCGFSDGADFQQEIERVTNAVHERFTTFFEHDTEAVEQAARDVLIILDRSAPEAEAREALARRGITEPDSLRLIHALAYGTRDVFVSAEGQRSFEQMLPALLRLTAAAPIPERVFSQFHSFALAIKGITYYYEVIAQHPDILKLLVTLFGTSEALSAELVAHPEFFDSLISTRILNESDVGGTARRERMNTVFGVKTPARRLTLLRRVVRFERLVIALQYLLRLRPLEACLHSLSDVADHTFETASHLACARLLSRWTDQERPDDQQVRALQSEISRCVSVLGLGKYGGEELNFFGDLDVVFVYDNTISLPAIVLERFSNSQEFIDIFADTVTAVISEQTQAGRAFEVDSRLRPHGRSAPLSTELQAYKSYLENEAETWELQAFHRARTVWGNPRVLSLLARAAESAARSKSRDAVAIEIATMRQRLEESVADRPNDIEIKRSPGGIVDIEFLLQYLVLTGQIPWSNTTSNYYSVLSGQQIDSLSEEETRRLYAGYRVLRGIENTIRIITGGKESSFVAASPSAKAVARSLGFESAEDLVNAINEVRGHVRQIYAAHLENNTP